MADRWPARAAFAGRFVVSGFLVLGVGQLAHLPLGRAPADAALRLAIRTAAAKLEVCRERSAAELAELPVHMRLQRVCEDRPVTYRLEVWLDGTLRHSALASKRGLRADRPLVIEETLSISPGSHAVRVRFAPELANELSPAETAKLPRDELEENLELAAGRVVLVTFDDRRGLALRAR